LKIGEDRCTKDKDNSINTSVSQKQEILEKTALKKRKKD